ncbi:MAG: hypothetical protein JJT96_02405 [Opitutales bacterium]|nr:hypothetical protein [Opitutales bacterium]
MSFWTAIVLIILIIFLAETLRPMVASKKERKKNESTTAKLAELEKRIASLESIAIERDRDQKFRDL